MCSSRCRILLCMCSPFLTAIGGTAVAQSVPAAVTGPLVDIKLIKIPIKPVNKLERLESTGSRLDLPPKETPASISTVTASSMQRRGYEQVKDAVNSTPGAISGGSPGDPSGFSIRGFTGDEVTVLRDGIYYGPSDMVNRPENSFNLKDVEVLRGPASVLFGQGAIGGVVNVITKEPRFGPPTYNADLTTGSFGTINFGVGGSAQVSKTTAVRLDVSRTSMSGFYHNDNPNNLDVTASSMTELGPDVQLKFAFEYVHDNLPSSYGTPLVPGADAVRPLGGVVKSSNGLTIDEPMRYNNYNVANAVHESNTFIPQATLTWEPTSNITVSNQIYYYYAARRWQNAETYTYIGPESGAVDAAGTPIPAGSVARDRFYVYHAQHQIGDDLHANVHDTLFGHKNQFTLGVAGYHIDFVRDRGFPNAQYADYVNALNPVQGSFGNFPGQFPITQAPTYISDAGLYGEDVVNLLPHLKLVTGARGDWFYLVRNNDFQNGSFNAATSFRATYHPFNYRAGLVYDVTPDVTTYAAYTTAEDPPGSNIFLANRGQIKGLSNATQEEIGAKATFLHNRADATVALYNIMRRHILVSTGPDTVSTVGSQRSQGVELTGDWKPTPHILINANAAYTHAKYGTFVDPTTGLNADGNEPPNVPAVTSNIWGYYTRAFGSRLDLGAGLRFVGKRAGNYANTLRLQPYTLVDLSVTYHATRQIEVTGRVDNLLDKAYASWADVNYPSEVLLGAPRAFYVEMRIYG